MANLPPGTVAVEFTIGTGPFFPANASLAANTTNAQTAVNTTAASGVGPAFPLNPTVGQTFYNTTLTGSYTWTGAKWQN